MRMTLPHHRHSFWSDIETELPLLVVGACLLAITVTAVYLYAAM